MMDSANETFEFKMWKFWSEKEFQYKEAYAYDKSATMRHLYRMATMKRIWMHQRWMQARAARRAN